MTTDNYQFYINKITTLEQQVARLVNQSSYGELKYGQGAVTSSSDPLIGSPSSTFTKNNNTTLSNVTGMTINLEASSRYMFLFSLDYTSSSVADLKFDLGPPATATGLYILNYLTTASASSVSGVSISGTPITMGGNGGSPYIAVAQGFITTVAADVIQFRAAQNTGEVSDTTIATDSYIFAWKLP